MMVENSVMKPESVLNLEDLLQCPVCYEIPPGQIFQCNEGHHVCGGCKTRLDVCPVCRALFFGTRNYAMEELISNFRKMRSLKSGILASGSGSSQSSTPAQDTSVEHENNASEEEDEGENNNVEQQQRPPQPCSGLFRCLCCKPGSTRLPSARLLNHLRYFHSPDLLEGRSENGEYLQAWQFSTAPGKFVTAVRISDMGIFFLTIDITSESLSAWLSMAASPWVAHEFSYTVTICGNDREAIFSDSVWSVRSCEGTLRKRRHCLLVGGADAIAMTAPDTISGKLSVRRTPPDQLTAQSAPRAVLRVANRGLAPAPTDLEPFLQELQNDVARLSRAFATLGQEATALVQSEVHGRARIANIEHAPETASRVHAAASDPDAEPSAEPSEPLAEPPGLSRCARKRLRQRMRAALEGATPPVPHPAHSRGQPSPAATQPRQNGLVTQLRQNTVAAQPRQNGHVPRPTQSASATRPTESTPATRPTQNSSQPRRHDPNRRTRPDAPIDQLGLHNTPVSTPRQNGSVIFSGLNILSAPTTTVASQPVAPALAGPSSATTSQQQPQTGNSNRNKKKRRHRR